MTKRQTDWNPEDNTAGDPIAAYDVMRGRCPVAHSHALHWSLFRHQDVTRALSDPETFSNRVSAHLSVPNGMDPPEHTEYRRIIEPYFSPERMARFEPRCRALVVELLEGLPRHGEVDLMAQFAEDFALQAQCAFLNWPASLHAPLRQWVHKNHEAARSRDRAAMAAVALEFDSHIREVLAVRRHLGAAAPKDVATELLHEQAQGRALTDSEIVSILRNWTVGELATIAACVGILIHFLAEREDLKNQLRKDFSRLPAAIDEILRIRAPLLTNRRITRKPVELSGRTLPAGERITLMWASANRDEAVFGDPDEFRLDRDPSLNLLYGAGIHVCPGAPLARLELRVLMEEFLAQVESVSLISDRAPVPAVYPASGFTCLPLRIQKT